MGRLVPVAVISAITVMTACMSDANRDSARNSSARAEVRTECEPAVMVIAPSMRIYFASEWQEEVLFVGGCRKDLLSSVAAQRKAASEWIRTYTESNPRSFRSCIEPERSQPPTAEAIAKIRSLMPGVSDWCWYFKSADM